MESLEADDNDVADPKQWADAWAVEIAKRLAAMDAGVPGIPAADAIAALRRRG